MVYKPIKPITYSDRQAALLKKKKPRRRRPGGGRRRRKQTVAGLKLGKLGSPVQLVSSRRKLGTNANSNVQMPRIG
jgi:hypothetical protein